MSTWPAIEREMRNEPLFAEEDPWFLREYAKFRRQFGTIVRLVAKRASKTNSWDLATLEERTDYLRRCHWDQRFGTSQIVILARAEHHRDVICRGRRRARKSWWSIRRGIDRWLAHRLFLGASAMLVSAHDGGVDHHVFVVVIAGQEFENLLENAALGPSVEALIDDLPVAKPLGQITPWDAGSKPEENGFDEQEHGLLD